MIHYIYKIEFLCGETQGRYYIGKRSYHGKYIEKDKYAGSGYFCICYYKKHGKVLNKTYRKTIIEINDNWETNKNRENIIIGDLWKTDPLCVNLCPGGISKIPENKKRSVIQYDLEGNIIAKYNSIGEAKDATGYDNIGGCCRGRSNYKTVGNYIWRYDGDPFNKYEIPDLPKAKTKSRKKINQYTVDGKYIKTWDSIKEAANYYSNSKNAPDNLSEALNGKINSWYGFIWKVYKNDCSDILITKKIKPTKKVQQFDLNGRFIAEYASANNAAKQLNYKNPGGIGKCASGKAKTAAGYIWKYV